MTSNMRAAVYRGPGTLEVTEVPRPEVGVGDCVVEVERCGICGTDLHMVLEGWGRPDSIGGHEWVGTIVEADDTQMVGRRVAGGPEAACGGCRHCRSGRSSLCINRDAPGVTPTQGAFAEYIKRPLENLVVVPDGLDSHRAALAEPLAVALHALTLGGVKAADQVLISGAGPIGAALVALLVHRGITPVVVEPATTRAALATELGALVMAPDELQSAAMPMDVIASPFGVVFECSGKVQAMETGLQQLDRAGRLVLVGTGMDSPRFDPNRILLNELVITGAFNYDDGGFTAALELLANETFPADQLIEPEAIGLDDLLATMQRLAGGQIAGKVMVKPS
ncbi:MAG: zinc-dependent alcohol dehydrogenase [Acidimicrobiales bacterium]